MTEVPENDSSEVELRRMIEDWVHAIEAKDVKKSTSFFSLDVISFDLIDPLQYEGLEEVRVRLTKWFASFNGPIDFAVHELHMTAADTAAYCHSLNSVKGTTVTGEKIDMYWRATLCFSKYGDSWMVTHSHASVPFDMTTGKASLGLNP